MRYTVEERDEAVVVRLSGEMVGNPGGTQLYEDLRRALAGGRTRFVVDLGAVSRMDAIGLGVALTLLALARNGGGALLFARVPPVVRSLLIITDLDAAFPRTDTVDGALDAVQQRATGARSAASSG